MLTVEHANDLLSQKDDWKLFEQLQELYGVGPKIANCIMCYALGFRNVTPINR